jgi:nitroreductase
MGLLPEIEKRNSVRAYTADAVDRETLERVLDAGRRAPSAKNRQSWRFIMITDHSLRARMQDAAFGQEYVGKAPAIVALCTTNVEYKMPNGQLSYPVDLAIAGSFMLLQAEHEGLGSCMVTTFREEEVKSALTVPYSMRVVLMMTLGWPADSNAERTTRLPVDRVVSWEHW